MGSTLNTVPIFASLASLGLPLFSECFFGLCFSSSPFATLLAFPVFTCTWKPEHCHHAFRFCLGDELFSPALRIHCQDWNHQGSFFVHQNLTYYVLLISLLYLVFFGGPCQFEVHRMFWMGLLLSLPVHGHLSIVMKYRSYIICQSYSFALYFLKAFFLKP